MKGVSYNTRFVWNENPAKNTKPHVWYFIKKDVLARRCTHISLNIVIWLRKKADSLKKKHDKNWRRQDVNCIVWNFNKSNSDFFEEEEKQIVILIKAIVVCRFATLSYILTSWFALSNYKNNNNAVNADTTFYVD